MNGQGYEQLTLFPEGSPASRLVWPGSSEARKMTATSGRKWLGLSRNSGPLGLLEKMLLESSEWHSPIFYLSWRAADIGQGHFLFQLVRSEPGISAAGWRLWAAPNTMDYLPQRSPEALKKQAEGSRAVKIYNTPTAQDGQNSTFPKSQINRDSLVGDVMREMFATPQARDYRTSQASRWEDKEHRSRNLNDQIAMYPTPTTGAGWNYQKLKKLRDQGTISEEERKSMSQGNGGQLNPRWVEWLMGFPPGWTETS